MLSPLRITSYQAATLATGLQPRRHSSFQLIEDGRKDPYKHTRLALS